MQLELVVVLVRETGQTDLGFLRRLTELGIGASGKERERRMAPQTGGGGPRRLQDSGRDRDKGTNDAVCVCSVNVSCLEICGL